MMDPPNLPRGPGKTAPRLINDLLDHDPRYTGRNGRNLLANPAQKFRGVALLRKGPQDCRHMLMKKPSQTVAPKSDDERTDISTKYVVASYCTLCKHHFDITVDYTKGVSSQRPCKLSDEANPMHHLRLIKSWNATEHSQNSSLTKYQPVLEYHRFICSGSSCPVRVEIRISSPRLPISMLQTLTNASELEARGRRVIAGEPERYVGLEPLSPMQVLSNLRQYLNDAKSAAGPDDIKRIARRNKKYFLAFADECDDLFTYLDFKAVTSEDTDPQAERSYFWQLPIITDVNRDLIDDVLVELDLLIADRPLGESRGNPKTRSVSIPLAASKDIKRSLGYLGYPTKSRTVDLSIEPHPHYASLGAMDDFTDELLIWAYDRQCECDPRNKPYYLDCLTGLANGRQSSDLHTRVIMATSAGEFGLQEIEEAYKFFTLDPNANLTDDHIIGTYKSRIESAPRQKDQARQSLRKIARARNSDKIEAVADDKTMSHNEALDFLGVVEETPSEFIISAVTALANESGADTDRIATALRVIAVHRDGDVALFLKAKDIAGSGNVAEAYQALDIRNRSSPDETILMFYKSRLEADADKPVLLSSHANSLRIIADDRESHFLYAKLGNMDAVVHTPNEPVGLDNIGNTCYLNSLLQFYYTIKAVRDVVINFDDYKMDLDSPNIEDEIKLKRVGGRKVQRFEIVKAQKVVSELRGLFVLLRTAPTKSVRPTIQLAVSLLSDSAEAKYRTKSISSPNGPPSLASIHRDGPPVFGPEGPPPSIDSRLSTTPVDDDIEMVDTPGDKNTGNGSETSETTLVDGLPPYSEGTTKDGILNIGSEEQVAAIIDPVDVVIREDDAVMVNGEDHTPQTDAARRPETPPPVPPRNKAGLSIQTSSNSYDPDLLSFGTQQDVQEVINYLNWRLSCAIKPTSIDKESGEQMDKIRDTFFGANAVYLQKAHITERKVETWQQLIVYPHPSRPRSIYEAFDVVFDEQPVEVGGEWVPQYASITHLPPVLQIHIQRVDFDELKKESFKNKSQIQTPETIYMDRYMDTKDPTVLKRRREAWKWRTQLRALEARQAALTNTETKVTVPDALTEVKRFVTELQGAEFEGLEIDAELPEALDHRIEEVKKEVEDLESKIVVLKRKIEEQFMDLTQYAYSLQTVFIHRGESGGGHYWIYIYDFEENVWREYNDDHVSRVADRNRIFNPDPQAGTPYYFAYVRSKDKQDIVDAVVREVEEVKEIEMVDISSTAEYFDKGIKMKDDEADETRHVEHVKQPRPILPKPSTQAVNVWENGAPSELDANGRKW